MSQIASDVAIYPLVRQSERHTAVPSEHKLVLDDNSILISTHFFFFYKLKCTNLFEMLKNLSSSCVCSDWCSLHSSQHIMKHALLRKKTSLQKCLVWRKLSVEQDVSLLVEAIYICVFPGQTFCFHCQICRLLGLCLFCAGNIRSFVLV